MTVCFFTSLFLPNINKLKDLKIIEIKNNLLIIFLLIEIKFIACNKLNYSVQIVLLINFIYFLHFPVSY